MNFQQKKAAIRTLILSLIIGVVVFTFLTVNWRGRGHLTQGFKSSSKLAYGKHISFVEYHGDKKVYAVSVDSFSVERARLGPFAIGPLCIAHLSKVVIDLYLDAIELRLGKEKMEEKGGEGGPLDLENGILSIKKNLPLQIRKIKGVEFKDISINLWRNEKKIFKISSDSATIDRKTGDLIFAGHADMDGGKNGKLQSHRIRWDRKTRFFKIFDPYYLIKDGSKMEGRGIETDYLFKKITYLTLTK